MIDLGDEVEDTVTGFSGIVVAKHFFLHSETTVSVQPKLENYGVLPNVEHFSETQVKTTKSKIKAVSAVSEIINKK